VNKYHAILSAAMRQAVKWDWIDRAPTARATPPRVHPKEMNVPTPEQLTTLVSTAKAQDPVLGCAIAVAALTGVRRGELVALQWSDFDLAKKTVRISKSLTVANGEQHVGATKTHAVRDLALDPVCVKVLRDHKRRMTKLADDAESPLVENPYVLSYSANGALPVNPDTLTHHFAALCRKLEEPALARLRRTTPNATRADLVPAKRFHFRFHDLRHFSVTTLIAAGVDVRTVANRHGHAKTTMTLDRYAHALPERDRAAAGILGKSLNW
jgi:integrase